MKMKFLNLPTLQVWHKGKLHYTVCVVPPTVPSEASLGFQRHTEDDSVFHQLVGKHGRILKCKSVRAAQDYYASLVQFAKQFQLPHLELAGSEAGRTGKNQISADERKVCHPCKAEWIGILKYMEIARQQDLSKIPLGGFK